MFVYGCIVGSFLNVCVYRLPRDRSVFSPLRSYCPICHEPIAWYDNIPLLSYFMLGRCCRHCGTLISPRYAVIELLTGLVFVLVWVTLRGRGERWWIILVYEALAATMICASAIDIELRMIPDSITLGGAALTPVLSALFPGLHDSPLPDSGRASLIAGDATLNSLAACFLGMAVGVATLWVVARAGKALFRKEAMGMGDIKYMALIGGLLGWQQTLLVFFLAPVFGAVIGLLILMRTRDHHIPYGPYLSLATIVVILWGPWILRTVQRPWLFDLLGMG